MKHPREVLLARLRLGRLLKRR